MYSTVVFLQISVVMFVYTKTLCFLSASNAAHAAVLTGIPKKKLLMYSETRHLFIFVSFFLS